MTTLGMKTLRDLAQDLGGRFSDKEFNSFFPRQFYTLELRKNYKEQLKQEGLEYKEKSLLEKTTTRDEKTLIDLMTMQNLECYINRLVLLSKAGRYVLAQLSRWQKKKLHRELYERKTDITEALMSDRIDFEDLMNVTDWQAEYHFSAKSPDSEDIQKYLKHRLINPHGVEIILCATAKILEVWGSKRNIKLRAELELFLRKTGSLMERVRIIKDKIVREYRSLVSHIVRRYGRSTIRQDLLQEGMIGLLKAIERFDAVKGDRFSVYASWWIRQEITRAIIYQGSVIRLPVRVFRKVNQIKNLKERVSVEHGEEPTSEELAAFSNLSAPEIAELQTVTPIIHPLEKGKPDDDDSYHLDIPDTNSHGTQLDFLERINRHEHVHFLLSCLDKREENIIKRRFGIEFKTPQTLDEIGRLYKLSRERIRQIEAKAIEKMKEFAAECLESNAPVADLVAELQA